MAAGKVYSDYYVGLRRDRIEEDPSLDEYGLDIFQGEDDWMDKKEMIKLLEGIRDSCDAAIAALMNE